jgi:hypothetical protein
VSDPELLALPLKSLELPSKTVAKLKPLGIETVGDLYKRTAADLAAAGLVAGELAEIEEAAGSFGVAWSAGASALAAKPAAAKPAAPKPAKPPTTAKRLALPADVTEALASDAAARLDLKPGELAALDAYVDGTKRHFKTPPPSPRLLRLVRGIYVLQDRSIGGSQRTYVVALIDVSQLPGVDETLLVHLGNLFSDVLVRIGVKPRSQSFAGCAVQLAIIEKDAPKARALAAEHARWLGAMPPFLAPIPPALDAWAKAGLAALR